MKVSLINLNLMAADAVGACIIEMARFLRERGDAIRIYVEHPPEGVPDDVAPLVTPLSLGQLIANQPHFDTSDLVIYHYPAYYGLLESVRGVERGAVLFDYHGVTPPDLWGSEVDREMLVRGQEGVRLVHYADLAAVHSPFTRSELASGSSYPADNIRLLPLWVPLDQFQPGPRDPALVQRYGLARPAASPGGDGQSVLLFVGRMAGNKRVDVLVRALAALRTQFPETKLLLVGDCDSSPAYREVSERARALAAELGLTEHVVFTGRVADLPAHYRLADVFVTASLHEGFGVPVVEAMASGVPVVASASAALPWTLGEGGLTFPPEDHVALADQVARLLGDAASRAEQIERGLARARQFSLTEYRANLARLVEETLARAASSPQRRGLLSRLPAEGGRRDTVLGVSETLIPAQKWDTLQASADVAMRGYEVRSDKPLVGPLIAWVRRNMTSHLREPYLDPIIERQVRFNQALVAHLRQWAGQVEGYLAQVESRLSQLTERQEKMAARQGLLETRVAAVGEALETLDREAEALRALLESDPARWQSNLATLRRLSGELPAEWQSRFDRLWDLLGPGRQEALGFSYRACAEHVGGDPEVERALYAPFVEVFAGTADVLDLGCGRGVFLQLLAERDIPARGIDLDEDSLNAARALGLDVTHGEALSYLESLPDDSLGGVFCAHLIEHLPKPRLVRLLELCHARLRPNALLVLVTPNAAGLTILHSTFYKDPTHRQPIHPQALEFLLEATGFRVTEVRFLSPEPEERRLRLASEEAAPSDLVTLLNENFRRLNDLLFGYLDCAVTAVKVAGDGSDQ